MIEYWQLMGYKTCTSWLLFATLNILSVPESSPNPDIDHHLETARTLVSQGMYQDALSHYHAAIEGSPKDYLTYFKRGSVFLALSKGKSALADFDTALELKPDFHTTRYQRGMLFVKLGEIEKAKIDLYNVYQSSIDLRDEAYATYIRLTDLQYEIDNAIHFHRNRDYHNAVHILNSVIESCPWSSNLRLLRHESYLAINEIEAAIHDLKTLTKLQPDSTESHLKLSQLYYMSGRMDDSLKAVRECLKLDPEHKKCFPFYKKVKKIEKLTVDMEEAITNKQYEICIDKAKKILLIEDTERMVLFHTLRKLCKCYLHNEQFPLSLEYCEKALAIMEDPDIHCDKAEVYIATEVYDEAIHEFQKALDIDRDHVRAQNGLNRAKKLQKQSEKRNYYKILGVERTASKQEIVKAYRREAMKWHPDSHQGEDKNIAKKKFIDIAAAKEVLTDPEKRQKFDNGEDPLDPESGNHAQGFNPFQNFRQFHGGPFQFQFHFN